MDHREVAMLQTKMQRTLAVPIKVVDGSARIQQRLYHATIALACSLPIVSGNRKPKRTIQHAQNKSREKSGEERERKKTRYDMRGATAIQPEKHRYSKQNKQRTSISNELPLARMELERPPPLRKARMPSLLASAVSAASLRW